MCWMDTAASIFFRLRNSFFLSRSNVVFIRRDSPTGIRSPPDVHCQYLPIVSIYPSWLSVDFRLRLLRRRRRRRQSNSLLFQRSGEMSGDINCKEIRKVYGPVLDCFVFLFPLSIWLVVCRPFSTWHQNLKFKDEQGKRLWEKTTKTKQSKQTAIEMESYFLLLPAADLTDGISLAWFTLYITLDGQWNKRRR